MSEDPALILDCIDCGYIGEPLIKLGGMICSDCRSIIIYRNHPDFAALLEKMRASKEHDD